MVPVLVLSYVGSADKSTNPPRAPAGVSIFVRTGICDLSPGHTWSFWHLVVAGRAAD